MAEQKLLFWRQVDPTPGDVSLVFGEYQPPVAEDPNAVKLRFVTKVAPTPGLVSLVFGAQPRLLPDVEFSLAAALPAVGTSLSLTAQGEAYSAATYVDGALAANIAPSSLPPLSIASAGIEYDQALPDAIGPGVFAHHLVTRDDPVGLAVQQQPMLLARTPAKAHQTTADPLHASTTARQQQMQPASRASAQRAQHGIPLGNGRSIGHADTLRHRRTITTPAQHGIPLASGTHAAHQERIRFRHRLRSDQTHAEKVATTATARAQQAHKTATPLYVGHQHAAKLPVGWWQATYPWPEPPFDPNAPSSPVALKFCRLADGTTALVFGCPKPATPGATIVVPVRRAYIVLNTISLVRVSDGAPLDATALSLQIDADSWTWGWDATIPGAQLALVEPIVEGDPVELLATLNGQQFRLLAERLSRDRSFGQSRLRISGRGRAAMLASPHSPVVTRSNPSARTIRQLLDDALTTNGVTLGWSVNWQAADWLVPAGAWNHTGSYIEHAQRIAEAAGAYVQSDPLTETLHILPRYPALPWAWGTATPDIILPSAPVVREAVEWLDKARYNRVFVSGTETGGILGQVTRTGTAGDVVAPMVTDPLCTHADAARARGGAVLADTGRQARITLDLPILTETGIIRPGALVEYTDAGTARRGLVRSTAVRAQLPTARQTIELETHV